MDRSCETCRHYYALFTRAGGTCHLKPPRLIGAEAQQDLDAPEADEAELRRWLGVLSSHLCARFAWRCQAPDCREPARAYTLGDELTGEFYCGKHLLPAPPRRLIQRRGAAPKGPPRPSRLPSEIRLDPRAALRVDGPAREEGLQSLPADPDPPGQAGHPGAAVPGRPAGRPAAAGGLPGRPGRPQRGRPVPEESVRSPLPVPQFARGGSSGRLARISQTRGCIRALDQ